MKDDEPRSPGASYTTVDLNSSGTTTVYNPDSDAFVYGTYMRNSGDSAIVRLEATDGTDTADLTPTARSGGADIAFGDTLELDGAQNLQINVTTVEGSDLTETAVVFHSDT